LRRRLIHVLTWLLALCVVVLLLATVYNSWASRRLAREVEQARREPGTDILLGGAPVEIDRGRERACLLLHGFMSTPSDFGELPRALDEAGWDVRAPLLPGHGTDPRQLVGVTVGDYLAHARRELEALRKQHSTVVVLGFSMGAAISVLLASDEPADGLVLVNPFLGVTYKAYYILPPRRWNAILGPFLDYTVRPGGVVHVNRKEAIGQIVCYRTVPTSAFATTFSVADAARSAGAPDVPLLVVISEDDSTADPQAARRFYEAANLKRKQLVTCPRSDHVLLLDYDREQAASAILEFLEELETP